jgi:DNA-binding transcriptional MocR family regulator
MADKIINIMWTPELKKNKKPLYLQLVDAMVNDIAMGKLAIGEKLPPQRQLAWHLEINLSTVTKAFKQAAKQHLISGEVGRGTYVLAQSAEASLYSLKQNNKSTLIDLSTHVPAEKPDDNDLALTIEKMMSNGSNLSEYMTYHTPETLNRIQLMAAKWLSQLGYMTPPKNCLVTTTAQNALSVTLLACCGKDDVVLVNELTFPGMKTVAKQLGLKLYGVAMDEQGILPSALDLAIRTSGAKVLVSDAIMQNPTASVMGEKRKKEFIDVLIKHQIFFIEEYVIGAASNITPVSTAIKKQSLLITSFAKAVCPGIRFAVIAGEHPLIKQLIDEPHATNWQLSPLMAEIACQWIDSGVAQQRKTWQRQEVCSRFRLFKKIFPSKVYGGNSQTCAHVWLPIKGSLDVATQELKGLGVNVVPASLFAVSRNIPNNIRISLSAAKSIQQLNIALNIVLESGLVKQTEITRM